MNNKTELKNLPKETNWKLPMRWSDYYPRWSDYYPANEWISKKGYVKVWRTGLSNKEMQRRGHPGRFIFASKKGLRGRLVKRYFKKKSDAMNYAAEFMMKN